jgi:ectoine hydroxylase-related dioxygenase (phytanoyl-CoA dioxygenase family)
MRAVRVVAFDKNPVANWGVPWHQDRVIVVKERADISSFSNWSCKSGAWHCEPPLALLDTMLFVRVHIDPSTAENGAMEIALGSHHAGKVRAENANEIAANYETELTVADPGDVLILAMLVLHRSLPSKSKDGRRALRIDYASQPLPEPLAWAS